MLLPSQFKALTEILKSGFQSLHGSLQDQICAIRDASKASIENQDKNRETRPNPLPVVGEISAPEADQREQRTHHYQSLSIQMILALGTWLAFAAAAFYAGVAYRQKVVMDNTYGEIQKQTKATQDASYAACLNAQAAQATFLQIQKSAIDSHAVALATVEQARVGIQAQRAYLSFDPRFPDPNDLVKGVLAIPYSLKNAGKSIAFDIEFSAGAVLLSRGEKIQITEAREKPIVTGGYMAEGEEVPFKPSADETNLNLKPVTISITVYNSNGQAVSASSQEARDYFTAGDKVIAYVFGRIKYSDFSGTHKAKFCQSIFRMSNHTFHYISPSEISCSKYNHQDDQYAAMPIVGKFQESAEKIVPVQCTKPNN